MSQCRELLREFVGVYFSSGVRVLSIVLDYWWLHCMRVCKCVMIPFGQSRKTHAWRTSRSSCLLPGITCFVVLITSFLDDMVCCFPSLTSVFFTSLSTWYLISKFSWSIYSVHKCFLGSLDVSRHSKYCVEFSFPTLKNHHHCCLSTGIALGVVFLCRSFLSYHSRALNVAISVGIGFWFEGAVSRLRFLWFARDSL